MHKEYNILKVQDMYQLAILKFYCKLVNKNLPQYFNALTPKFSVGHINYNLRNPTRQLPTIRHEFPRQSLRYKLIATLNEIPESVLAIAHNQPQQQFIHIVKDIGYEPADLTVHPPPPRTAEGGFIFFV